MKNRVLVLLLVLSLALASVSIVSAQGGGDLKAVTTDTVTLYADPSTTAEAVADISAYSIVAVTGTDQSGAWLKVSADAGEGYIMADAATVLDLPLLAPKAMVATSSAGATALYPEPSFAADLITSLPDGTVASILATKGQWAYVQSAAGTGWAIASDWEALPADAAQAIVELGSTDALGVFAQAMVGSDLVEAVDNGAVVWEIGTANAEWTEVLLPDGKTGYAITSSLSSLPLIMADAESGSQSNPALYDQPDFGANLLGELANGEAVTVLADVDDFWAEVYTPAYGIAYTLKANLGPKYTVATVQVQDAIVRAGPNDNVYNAIATLPVGTKVVVKGISESGVWVQVGISFNEVDFGYYGVSGWMRDYLFKDADGNSSLDTSILSVTE